MGVYRVPSSLDDVKPPPIHDVPFPPQGGLGKVTFSAPKASFSYPELFVLFS
jgi:hypothetical protein